MRNVFTRESPTVFHALIEMSRDAFYVVSPAAGFRLVYANSAAVEFMEYPHEKLLCMTLPEWDPNLRLEQLEGIWQQLKHQGSVVFTTSVRKNSGERVPLEMTMNHLVIEGEEFMAGSFRDIAERKSAEEAEHALRRSEAQLRTLIETLPDLVWLKDPDGVYLTCNHRFERFFGAKKRTEIVGKTDYDFLDRELADFFREKDKLAMELGKPSMNEEEITYADDGHRELLETIKTPMYGPKGELIGVLGIARDITERKRLEAGLKEGFEVYQAAINTPALGFWMADPQGGRILEVNDAYVGQSGYSREELLRMAISDLDALERPEETASRIEAIMQAGYARFQTQHRRKDGTFWPVEVITSFSKTQGGRFFVFLEDITERKRAEEALNRVNEELEARVGLRTAELSAAKDEAERASKAKSEFLSTMSHELRTPLNAILGYSQLMQLQPDTSASQRENLGEVLKAGRHLLDLINQVLDLAKVESGHVDLAIENVACRALLEDCLRLIEPTAQVRSIELQLLPDALPEKLFVRADLMRLRQVLLNLVSNAVKYNRDGGQVLIRLEAGTGGRLRFRVQDTGVGIPSERQAELFQPFNRIGAQNSAVEGAGIGLVISRALIDAMGGEIGFESRAGEGSAFWVELPRVEQQDDTRPDARSEVLPVLAPAIKAAVPMSKT